MKVKNPASPASPPETRLQPQRGSWSRRLLPLLVGSALAVIMQTAFGQPVIVTPPASQTAYLGQTVTMTVAATGTNLTYQWQAGTTGSGIYTNLSNANEFSGVTTNTLTIS